MRLNTINDVADAGLCSGCGACATIAPEAIEMEDRPEHGRRPHVQLEQLDDLQAQQTLAACPGIELSHNPHTAPAETIKTLQKAWGPVLQLWEGHAGDESLRYSGSSGGAASALALFALEQRGFEGVLHTAARQDAPYLNTTVFSCDRDALLQRTGSRYAPASPCEGLRRIECADGPCVFIGKPCDVAGAQKARHLRPQLERHLGLTIAFFCAGTPTTQATLTMLREMGIDAPEQLEGLRYRGNGWPGKATVSWSRTDGTRDTRQLTYDQAWGQILAKHVQWRCKLCADHTGEFADIAVGDPWYRAIEPGESGSSLILARTEYGRTLIEKAIAGGYLQATSASPERLPDSQPNLLRTRGSVWGRLWTLRLLGYPAPRYRGMAMFGIWCRHLSLKEKLRSTLGTLRRVWRRRRQ
jgi:coenzyme F420 hydrogenase subunit beta